MRHSIECPRSSTSSWRHRQRLAGRDPDLLLDQVDARDHLADRVLDLDARVHLHEAQVAVVVEQELHRARRPCSPPTARRCTARSPMSLPLLVGEVDRGRLLDQLLVAALHRAVALEEVDAVAVAVADELDLGVARRLEVALDVDGAVLEDRLGGRARGLVEAREVLRPCARRSCRARRRPRPP